MTAGINSANHRYVEFDMSKDEQIRVTYIPVSAWAGGPTVRIQKHAHTGRISPGPELPAEHAMELIAAVSALVTGRA